MLGIFAEGRVGFRETELLPFKEGAVVFATASAVPIVPAAIVGSTYLWLGRQVEIRFGDPIPTDRHPRQSGPGRARGAGARRLRGAAPGRRAHAPALPAAGVPGDLFTGERISRADEPSSASSLAAPSCLRG